MNSPAIANLSSSLEKAGSHDLLLVALGYEARAIAVASRAACLSRRRVALGFDHNKAQSYESNEAWFRANDFEVNPDLSADQFANVIEEVFSSLEANTQCLQIAVDVSCFDRHRLAVIVEALDLLSTTRSISVDFFYCLAKFQTPLATLGRNEFAGPVHRKFAGRFLDPSRPLAMVAGLGYEIGKVVGAAEYLQASRVIALFPESPIAAYEPAVKEANRLLLEDMSASDIIRYPVDDCRKTLATLDSIVRGLRDTHNIVLLPGGPKIFVLACLLVQRAHRYTSAWRVSSGSSITARDVLSSGQFVGMRWMPNPERLPRS